MRRTWFSIRPLSVSPDELVTISELLSPLELQLWERMSPADQSHSMMVLRRFNASNPESPLAVQAGVLLHDVGKIYSNLSTPERILATVFGPRTQRFRQYHDHEALGRELLLEANSDPLTIATACAVGFWGERLRQADRI